MRKETLNHLDLALIEQARRLIAKRRKADRHEVSAALRTKEGSIYEGIHLETYIGRMAVCAEAIALGSAAVKGDTVIETIVAVNKNGEVVSPCGMCREMIADYAPEAMVKLKDAYGIFKTCVQDLIPLKYIRN